MDVSWLLLELVRTRQLYLRNELIRCLSEDETSRRDTIDGLIRVASAEAKEQAIPAVATIVRVKLFIAAGELEEVFDRRFSSETIDNLGKFPDKHRDELAILVALLGHLHAVPAEVRNRIAGRLAGHDTFKGLVSRLSRS